MLSWFSLISGFLTVRLTLLNWQSSDLMTVASLFLQMSAISGNDFLGSGAIIPTCKYLKHSEFLTSLNRSLYSAQYSSMMATVGWGSLAKCLRICNSIVHCPTWLVAFYLSIPLFIVSESDRRGILIQPCVGGYLSESGILSDGWINISGVILWTQLARERN